MIYLLIGNIGSGKSLTAVKLIVDKQPQKAYTNFRISTKLNYHRIKISDIIKTDIEKKEQGKKGKPKTTLSVNWSFWEKVRKTKNFSIYLDEIHNIIHSRRSMSSTNILMSKWVSQIRKITNDSQDNHLILISQTLSKVDKDFRDLASVIIKCDKQERKKRVIIRLTFYSSIEDYLYMRPMRFKITFIGNKYFNYYDSTELIKFDDAEIYI